MRKKIFRGIPNWYEELCCYIGHAAIAFYLIMIAGGILTCIVNKVCNKSEDESKEVFGDPNDPDRYKEVKLDPDRYKEVKFDPRYMEVK